MFIQVYIVRLLLVLICFCVSDDGSGGFFDEKLTWMMGSVASSMN